MASSQNEYPSEAEAVVIAAAGKPYGGTMKKYDPSHDALHGIILASPAVPVD
ncbi:hypothetical protein RhiLY_03453 [Ceratobasidium sp. AG-Ba]|nr:hypothetical protein RhiLY_03453 [Ceratobasidium sp. AG-Ba]